MFVVYLLLTLSWGGRVHGRTRKLNYVDDLYDRSANPEEKQTVQTVEEKHRTEVYQEDTPTMNNYFDLRRKSCFKGTPKTRNGYVIIECNVGCRLTCVPRTCKCSSPEVNERKKNLLRSHK